MVFWGESGSERRARILPLFHLTSKGPLSINRWPCRLARGAISFAGNAAQKWKFGAHGGVPEWLKGTDCKSVGFAYAGSNPAPSTSPAARRWSGAARIDRFLSRRPSGGVLERKIAFVLELHAGDPAPEGLPQKPVDPERRLLGAQAAAADVGDAVALAVLAPDARRPCQVGAEAVGRGKPRPLADQYEDRASTKH